MARTKTAASWSSVKAGLRDFDRAALLGVLQDLYAASKDNKAFLHARLNQGGNPLVPYKTAISRWICPDAFSNQPVSVAKAKKAIAFLNSCGMEDEGYYAALVRMFEQALKWAMPLPANRRALFLNRLQRVREAARRISWGVGDGLGDLWDAVADDGAGG